MKPITAEEDFIANVLADALCGQLRIGFGDAARIAKAAANLNPERVAPLALLRWATADPRAQDILRSTLGSFKYTQ